MEEYFEIICTYCNKPIYLDHGPIYRDSEGFKHVQCQEKYKKDLENNKECTNETEKIMTENKNTVYMCCFCREPIYVKEPLWYVADGVTHGHCSEKMNLYLKGDTEATREREENFRRYKEKNEK